MSTTRGKKENPKFAEKIESNSSFLLSIFSEMDVDDLAKLAAVSISLEKLFRPTINARVKFGNAKKFPSDLVVHSICNVLKPHDQSSLSKVNKFFNESLKFRLEKEKKRQKDILNDEISHFYQEFDRIGAINPEVDYQFTQLLAKVFNANADHSKICHFLKKAVLHHFLYLDATSTANHLFFEELMDEKERRGDCQIKLQKGIPKLIFNYKQLNQPTLCHIAKIYSQYYPGIQAFVKTKESMLSYSQLQFNLNEFLYSVLPAMRLLTDKPSYKIPDESSSSLERKLS